jgi:hypothetical protein
MGNRVNARGYSVALDFAVIRSGAGTIVMTFQADATTTERVQRALGDLAGRREAA